MTILLRLIFTAFLVTGAQAAHGSSTSSEAPSATDSLVIATLATAPTYMQGSTGDLLTAAIGQDASACTVSSVPISPAHFADLAQREVLRRKPLSELLTALREGNIADGKALQAIQLLEKIKGPELEADLRQIAEPYDGNLGNYLALLHLSDRCDIWSLHILNDHWFDFGIPSFVWAEAVEDFGKCHYLPATANLISTLDAASGNLVDAASDSLRRLYPTGPKARVGHAPVNAWTAYVSADSKH
jgi:hypothetical protein